MCNLHPFCGVRPSDIGAFLSFCLFLFCVGGQRASTFLLSSFIQKNTLNHDETNLCCLGVGFLCRRECLHHSATCRQVFGWSATTSCRAFPVRAEMLASEYLSDALAIVGCADRRIAVHLYYRFIRLTKHHYHSFILTQFFPLFSTFLSNNSIYLSQYTHTDKPRLSNPPLPWHSHRSEVPRRKKNPPNHPVAWPKHFKWVDTLPCGICSTLPTTFTTSKP